MVAETHAPSLQEIARRGTKAMTVSYSRRPFLDDDQLKPGQSTAAGIDTCISMVRSNSHLHHRRKTFAGEPATGCGALPLSYARHLRTATAAGFEPATSRLTVEVTHVFTTGKVN